MLDELTQEDFHQCDPSTSTTLPTSPNSGAQMRRSGDSQDIVR